MAAVWVAFGRFQCSTFGPPALEDRVRALRRPLLLISAGTAEEYEFNVLYDEAGGPNVEHWNLPDVGHTDAVRQAAVPYEQRVTAFFARTIGP